MFQRRARVRRAAVVAVASATVALGLLPAGMTAPGAQASATETASAAVPQQVKQTVAARRDACGRKIRKRSGRRWRCTFVDNFSRSGQPDEDKWLSGETLWSGFSVEGTCIKAGKRNVKVRRGKMVLKARDEGSSFTCKNPLADFDTRYTGASVGTRGRFSQAYGRFEVRAKLPATNRPGLHAAFWLYPTEHTYGRWPNSGEIDIAEWWSGTPRRVLPSLHYPGRKYWADTGWWCRVRDVNKFHTYAIEWNRRVMRFYQDGRQCWKRKWQPTGVLEAPQPFDHPFNIALTMAVDNSGGRNGVTARTKLPAKFVIDHVKVWK
ncbi:glycoside hydrolase family 16 protein [Nocardioides panacisoli]|uniref:glycoside hydrolase family 16 protein n=1 Tax=Nocardioides panacisoli TaxID=627624 RepID=UPI001C634B44|nr:glycoside hydrolase family 16 protein [Nocardioides panacisoli]QYJ03899.1 glycoside hydrolase family 16 protein [Nocardioides panacisoli]